MIEDYQYFAFPTLSALVAVCYWLSESVLQHLASVQLYFSTWNTVDYAAGVRDLTDVS